MTLPHLLNIGYDTFVSSAKLVALLDYENQAVKNMVKEIKEEKPWMVVSVTKGKKMRTCVVLLGGYVFISPISRRQLAARLSTKEIKEKATRVKVDRKIQD